MSNSDFLFLTMNNSVNNMVKKLINYQKKI